MDGFILRWVSLFSFIIIIIISSDTVLNMYYFNNEWLHNITIGTFYNGCHVECTLGNKRANFKHFSVKQQYVMENKAFLSKSSFF